MKYKLELVSGMNFYEVSSAFQKCVRRGMLHEAMWFGTELYLSGYEEYVWFRIRVMVSEDVGLAEPQLPAQIQALYQTYLDFKKKKNQHGPERLPFVHALQLLVRSCKSRMIDNYLCEYMFTRDKVAVPDLNSKEFDFVWDAHTLKGKQLGRGNDFFYEHSAKIANVPEDLFEEEFEVRDRVWKHYQEIDEAEAELKSKREERRKNRALDVDADE